MITTYFDVPFNYNCIAIKINMRKLEIRLTETQYQKMKSIIGRSNADHLGEGVFGGYELWLSIGIPDIFPATLEIKTNKSTELGEVKRKTKRKI